MWVFLNLNLRCGFSGTFSFSRRGGGFPAGVVVIHDLNLALRFCDQFLLLRQGMVYRCGGKEILDRQALKDVYKVDASVVDVEGHSMVIVDADEPDGMDAGL